MDWFNDIDLIATLLSLPAIIIALSFHEAAHAYIAYRCGDPTAQQKGRMTLNPLKHIDPIGFLMLLVVRFGYAKPVPVNPLNFRRGYKDDFLVSIAGIATNLMLAIVFSIGYVTIYIIGAKNGATLGFSDSGLPVSTFTTFFYMIYYGMSVNIALAVFNFLPIPPLDGFHIFNDLIFRGQGFMTRLTSGIGQLVLLALVFTGITSKLIGFILTHYMGLLDKIITSIFILMR